MSKTVEITSPEQFSDILSKSRIVVADCKPFIPLQTLGSSALPRHPILHRGRDAMLCAKPFANKYASSSFCYCV